MRKINFRYTLLPTFGFKCSTLRYLFTLGFILLLISGFSACGVELTQGNSDPFVVSVGPITLDPNHTDRIQITYAVADFQQDDANVDLKICYSLNECYPAVADPNYATTLRIPTIARGPNGYSASHIFTWNPVCGLLDTKTKHYITLPLTQDFYIEIKLHQSNSSFVKSETYNLDKLGMKTQNLKSCN